MLTIAQGLSIFFLASAALSSILLTIAYQWDAGTFDHLKITKRKTTPGLLKSARLFGAARNPKFQVLYLLSLIFVLFAYVAIVLLGIHVVVWLFS